MKYKVLLILEEYNLEIIEKLNQDYQVDCLNQQLVKKVNKNNIRFINYEDYLAKNTELDVIVKKLDSFRNYSFIISDYILNNNKYVDLDTFLKWSKVPSKYSKRKLNILINGYDLKFMKSLYPLLEKEYNLTIIEHSDYLLIDKEACLKALETADIIWCEWLVENARWFSYNVKEFQRLIIRAHRFELYKNYGYKLKMENVEKIITVGYYYYEEFIKKFDIPRNKMTIVPNFIECDKYLQTKKKDSQYNIALIGALPKRKGLHRAIKILFELKKKNMNYKLHILGLKPEDLTSTNFNQEEKKYYQDILHNIKIFNLEDDIIFTGWVDVKKYLTNIGYVLSLSDKEKPESFHITPFEGLASGSMALATYWPGIEFIYPDFVIKKDEDEIVKTILDLEKKPQKYQQLVKKGQEFIKDNYDIKIVYSYIASILRGEA